MSRSGAQALARLKGIEDRVWMRVEGCPKVYAIADEDLERENEEKTSAVHFLRFELTDEMAAGAQVRRRAAAGVDHAQLHRGARSGARGTCVTRSCAIWRDALARARGGHARCVALVALGALTACGGGRGPADPARRALIESTPRPGRSRARSCFRPRRKMPI